jgi:hypothetical protein
VGSVKGRGFIEYSSTEFSTALFATWLIFKPCTKHDNDDDDEAS